MTTRTDRLVHATLDLFDLARYDRSGKWSIEHRNGHNGWVFVGITPNVWANANGQANVTISQAAQFAAQPDATWHEGISGGSVLDRRVRAIRGNPDA